MLHQVETLQNLGHPRQFLQFSTGFGGAGPRADTVHGEPHEGKVLVHDAHPSQQTDGTVPVGETARVVHAFDGFGHLMGQHETRRVALFGPRCKVVFPCLTVVPMRMQHDRHAALHRIVKMDATVEVADHGHQRKITRYRAGRSVGGDEDDLRPCRGVHVLDGRCSANHHHARCGLAASDQIMQGRFSGLSSPVLNAVRGIHGHVCMQRQRAVLVILHRPTEGRANFVLHGQQGRCSGGEHVVR